MNNLGEQEFDTASVEAMLKAAGDYVGPSDDLRPRVLEEARRQLDSGRRRRRLTLAGSSALAAVALLSIQASSLSESLSEAAPSQRVARLVADSNATGKSAGEGLWALVDAFFTIRNEQAEALHPAADSTQESSELATQIPPVGGSL